MKKVLISLLLGVSMVTMAGCGNADKEVVNTKVEQIEREGAYPNFQDKETDEPISNEEDREERAVEAINNQFAKINAQYNSEQSEVEATTVCYIDHGTIHVYDFMDYSNSNECTNEEMAIAIATCFDEESLNNSLEISEIMIERVKTTFKLNALDLNNYEIRYHNCIGNPHNETFYEIMVVDGDGNVLELFGEAIN